MHIHDFYAKLTASNSNHENPLFAALRKLTRMDDPKAAFSANDDGVETWATWVPASLEA